MLRTPWVSLRDTLLTKVSDSHGWRVTPTSFIRGEIGSSLRVDDDEMNNITVKGQVKYYNIFGAVYLGNCYVGKHTFASALTIDIG